MCWVWGWGGLGIDICCYNKISVSRFALFATAGFWVGNSGRAVTIDIVVQVVRCVGVEEETEDEEKVIHDADFFSEQL